jgi:hypothetical protein
MSKGIASVHVRNVRGKLSVEAMGQTPRGQKYIKDEDVLATPKMADPKFKGELAAAITKLLGEAR